MANIKKVTKTVTKTVTTRRVKAKKVLKSRIAIILDRSGSMDMIRGATVEAFNSQVKAIKKAAKKLDTRVSFITFSDLVDLPRVWNEPVETLRPLTYNDYIPGGSTAMYDAVGETLNRLTALPEALETDTSFLVVVLSDGQENSSRIHTAHSVAERIKTLQSTGRWTFTYIGANQDLSEVSRTLNIPIGNTMAFVASNAGVVYASHTHNTATSNYLRSVTNGVGSCMDFYSDPAPAVDSTLTSGTTTGTVVPKTKAKKSTLKSKTS